MRIETEQHHAGSATAADLPIPNDTQSGAAKTGAEGATASSKADVVSLSPEAMAILERQAGAQRVEPATGTKQAEAAETAFADPEAVFGDSDGPSEDVDTGSTAFSVPTELTASDRNHLAQLRMKDAAVRSLQFSRIAMAGSLAGSQNTQFTSGPDGRLYATSGDVDVDTRPGHTPTESLSRASTLRRVSTTPAHAVATTIPHENVAVQAAQLEYEARTEINEQRVTAQQQSAEQGAQIQTRDNGAAAEAAIWNAPPEFTVLGLTGQEDGDVVSTTSGTELVGAEAVTEVESSARATDEPSKRGGNLSVLFADQTSEPTSDSELDIVA